MFKKTETNSSVLILGGGMAGLISGWYLKNIKNKKVRIITDKIGGWQNLTKKAYKFGPRLLKVDSNAEELLKSYNLPLTTKTIFIGYEKDDKITDNIDSDFSKLYAQRTRESEPKSTHLSSGKNSIEVYDIDYDVVLEKIENDLKENIIIGKIESVSNLGDDTFNKPIYSTKYLAFGTEKANYIGAYDLLSTLPLNILVKLLKSSFSWDFSAFSTSFVYSEILDEKLIEASKKYSYVYSVSDPLFHRINFLGDNKCVCEYKGKFDITKETSSRFKFIESTTIPFAQIKTDLNMKIFNNINLIGRYAQWKHGIVINDVLKSLSKDYGDY